MSYKTLTSGAPYYDDSDADKNFMRLLFQPGRAVQARELTALQTILQKQTATLSNHILQDGALIIDAKVRINPNKTVITPSALDSSGNLVVPSDFLDKIILGETSQAVAKVSLVDDVLGLLYLDTLSGLFIPGEKFVVIISNADHTPAISTNTTIDATITAIGAGTIATSDAGIIYMAEQYVIVPEQTVIVDPMLNTGTYHVGYARLETITTSDDDTTLLDPASGSSNQQAPGADRYTLQGILTSYKNDEDVPRGYSNMLTYSNGTITRKVEAVAYADLLDVLARRTYEIWKLYCITTFTINIILC